MGAWNKNSKTRVVSMTEGDFFGSEKSITNEKEQKVRFVLNNKELREPLKLLSGEILDTAVMSQISLKKFIENCMKTAKNDKILFSFHLKATMMKVSDPIIFGVILKTFFAPVFAQYNEIFESLGVSANNGLSDLLEKIKGNPAENEILTEIDKCLAEISVAMVNSEKNISNFSVPSDTIIDASMPAMIKSGGKMWDKKGELQDTLAIIPDRSYSGVYDAVVEFCKEHGAFDPRTIGSVSNVGLMAKQAEEYGSHNKTFLIEEDGIIEILSEEGEILMSQKVQKGDIFRACQTKHDSIVNWAQLSVERARITNTPVIFWLDIQRAHDKEIIKKLIDELKKQDIKGLDIKILSPKDACIFSCERMIKGLDTISATGNVLRDYLTDLFPIIELGTSAKMLSIVPLMAGGGLFETGAGGSAPKHVQQFVEENYLRWDSLGEFMAIVPSLEKYAQTNNNPQAKILAETLDEAIEKILENQKSPNREPISLDNRGSHFYLALYWAKALSEQKDDDNLAKIFTEISVKLSANEGKITDELFSVQKKTVDLGGYYFPDDKKMGKLMRPSETFNEILK
jgi:isocitrate dehydrogenase